MRLQRLFMVPGTNSARGLDAVPSFAGRNFIDPSSLYGTPIGSVDKACPTTWLDPQLLV